MKSVYQNKYMKIDWTEPKPPTRDVSFYDHIVANTPLGTFMIEWKSWKDSPSYDIMLEGSWIGAAYSLDGAKKATENYIYDKIEALNKFIHDESLTITIKDKSDNNIVVEHLNQWRDLMLKDHVDNDNWYIIKSIPGKAFKGLIVKDIKISDMYHDKEVQFNVDFTYNEVKNI